MLILYLCSIITNNKYLDMTNLIIILLSFMPYNRADFYNGQILRPDYIHSNELIVNNAYMLNLAILSCKTKYDLNKVLKNTTLIVVDSNTIQNNDNYSVTK